MKRPVVFLLLPCLIIASMPFQHGSWLGTTVSTATTAVSSQESEEGKALEWPRVSGFAGELYYRVIRGNEQQVLALKAGEIDLVGGFIDNPLVPTLYGVPDIELNVTGESGFGRITFNCGDPTGITSRQEFRQAFAHALDKNGIDIQIRVSGGHARSVNSIVPPVMGAWSLDNHPELFTENYYGSDPAKGNALLDAHGWVDFDGDGWRDHPDTHGPVNVEILCWGLRDAAESTIVDIVTRMAREALASLNIKSYIVIIPFPFNTYLGYEPSSTLMRFRIFSNLGTLPAQLLDFVTGALDTFTYFSNATYDTCVQNMLATRDVDEAIGWALKAQQILWEQQPAVVAYQNLCSSAYRTDRWTGHVNTAGEGVCSPWTFRQIRLKVGGDEYGRGGRFMVGLPGSVESTNPLDTGSPSSWMIMNMVYDKLVATHPYDPAIDRSWLARDWKIEEVNASSGDPAYQDGDTVKITYALHDNVYWHDYTAVTPWKVTSADVAYTYELMQETGAPSWASTVQHVTHVETPDPLTAVVYTDLTGLFAFRLTAGIVLLPKHVWEPLATSAGWEGVLNWDNPVPVGCGPYRWDQHVPGVFVVLERYDDYLYNPARLAPLPPSVDTTTTTTTTSNTASSTTSSDDLSTSASTGGFPGLTVLVLLTGVAAIIRRKRYN